MNSFVSWFILVSGLIVGCGPLIYMIVCYIRYPEHRSGTMPPGDSNLGNGSNVSL